MCAYDLLQKVKVELGSRTGQLKKRKQQDEKQHDRDQPFVLTHDLSHASRRVACGFHVRFRSIFLMVLQQFFQRIFQRPVLDSGI